jgi:MoxR-like ATPase
LPNNQEKLSSQTVAESAAQIDRIIDNIETVIIGKRSAVELVVLSMLSGGHVLIEDVPGVGKTSLVSALAKSIDCDFSRIQFTPDVMPSDVTGFSIFNQKTREFEFRPGAVISNIILADEINRASAKTQSSLLEAMEERQVTVDAQTYELADPFMVLATENPLESFGTYPLPEAQIDRFLIKISIGYPSFDQEVRVVDLGNKGKAAIKPVVTGADIVKLKMYAGNIHVSSMITNYIVQIVTSTRNHAEIQIGSSPRGSIALYNLSRAYALSKGRNYVIPDDIKYLAPYVLTHRISLTHEAKLNGRAAGQIIDSILSNIVVPIMDANEHA